MALGSPEGSSSLEEMVALLPEKLKDIYALFFKCTENFKPALEQISTSEQLAQLVGEMSDKLQFLMFKVSDFPQNKLGLMNGVKLKSIDSATEEVRISAGQSVRLFFDGTSVSAVSPCGETLKWDLEQLRTEIQEYGIWQVDGI